MSGLETSINALGQEKESLPIDHVEKTLRGLQIIEAIVRCLYYYALSYNQTSVTKTVDRIAACNVKSQAQVHASHFINDHIKKVSM